MYVEMASRKRLDRVWERRVSIHEAGVRVWDVGFGGEVVVATAVVAVVVGGLSKGESFRVFRLRVVGWWIWREESVCEGNGPERGVSS